LAGIVISPQHCSGFSARCPARVREFLSWAIIHPTDLQRVASRSAHRSSIRVQPSPRRESSHSTSTSCMARGYRFPEYRFVRFTVRLRARRADAATRRYFLPTACICRAARVAISGDVLSQWSGINPPCSIRTRQSMGARLRPAFRLIFALVLVFFLASLQFVFRDCEHLPKSILELSVLMRWRRVSVEF